VKIEKSMYLKKIALSLIVLGCSSLHAQGIILNDENLRNDLNWLTQQGVIQISTSTWPMSGDEIRRALSQAKINNRNQEKILQSVKLNIARQNTIFSASLFAESEQKDLPQQFGDEIKAQYQMGLEANLGDSNWDAKIRINAEKDLQIDHDQDINIEGSYVAGKVWNQWLIAGQIPTYWGPGQDGSLIRGDASRPVYGVTMQRAEQTAFDKKWLSWLGNWQYQAFVGRLDDYKAVPDTNLMGLRVTAQPWSILEVGASRVIQIDGDGQPDGFKAYWNAFIGKDNECTSNGCTGNGNASNQLGGLDARLNFQSLFHIPMSLYGQYVGEDEAGLLPSKKMYLAGLDYSSAWVDKPYRVYAEWVDTRTNGEAKGISYNHHIYKDGYYQHGFALGHGLGGDAEMISVGGNIYIDAMNRLSARVLSADINQSNRVTNQAFSERDTLRAVDVTWQHQLRVDLPIRFNAWASDSDVYGSDIGASVGFEIPLDKTLFGY
jgi:hypothetical protein